MKKQYFILTVILTFLISMIISFANIGFASPDDLKTINITREIVSSATQVSQKQELIVPDVSLDFDSVLNWDVTINKKTLMNEKTAAYFSIEEIGGSSREIARKTVSGSGSLVITKGTRYKITLFAGEYTQLLNKSGAEVNAKLDYTETMVRYSQGDKPYQFNYEIIGPQGLKDWNWLWSKQDSSTGNKVTHQFGGEGKTPVIVQGSGATSTGTFSRNYYFEFDVPPLIVLNPKLEPLKGPAELSFTALVNASINYGQKATYNWNFGDGAESTGSETNHIYNKPGWYQVILTAKVNDLVIEKSWLVNVTPIVVSTGATVTPASGSVPMEVTGNVNSKVLGGPTNLSFLWNVAGETSQSSTFKHVFNEPGTYRITLKTEDKLHPDLVIPDEVFTVNALPPLLTLKPSVSLARGYIPFTVNFIPNVKIQGAPVDLTYRWDFGDGEFSNLEKPSHTFKKPGQYQTRVTVFDRLHMGNLAENTIDVEILPPAIKVTALSDVKNGIVPLTVNFYAQVSVTGSPSEPLYFWDFGDGETSFEQNPVHVFKQSGKYTVNLEVKDRLHLGNSVKTTMLIEAKIPKLTFTAAVSPLTGVAPLTVNCIAKGQEEGNANPELKYVWDFGDGTTLTGSEQKHIFQKPGTYNILVYVEDSKLGITERKVIKVTVKKK